MSEAEHDLPLTHDVVTGDADGPESLMEQLRAQREDIAENRDTFIPITGYEELGLRGQHRLMDRPEVEKLAKRVFKETKDRGERQMRILLDQIIASTTGFAIVKEGDPVPVTGEDGATITTWDQLAEFMGWTPPDATHANARSALYYVFADNEFAIGGYGIVLNRWMGNTNTEVDGEFLGEAG